MNRLLNVLGLMRVSEHEAVKLQADADKQLLERSAGLRAAALHERDKAFVERDDALAKYKKAITDLAAAREEIEVLNEKNERKAVLIESAEATINYLRGEINRLTPDAEAMRRKRERDRNRRKGKV